MNDEKVDALVRAARAVIFYDHRGRSSTKAWNALYEAVAAFAPSTTCESCGGTGVVVSRYTFSNGNAIEQEEPCGDCCALPLRHEGKE